MEVNQIQPIKRRNRRKAGSVEDAKRILWQAITKAAALLEDDDLSTADTLKLLHGLSQAAGTYTKILESPDLAQRIEALELAASEATA